MRRHLPTILTAVLPILAGLATAEEPKGQPRSLAALTTFDDLQKRLGDSKLRLIDARSKADYDKGHIPGAVWADAGAAAALAARPGGLVDKEAWEAWAARLGISPEAEVLVYDGNRQLDAARLWWLLSYLGVEKIGLIDGNLPLWRKEGRPVSTDESRVEPRPFRVAFREARRATRADVLAALKAKSARVVDARSEAEHTGAQAKSKRGGRVPEACHLEWSTLVDADGRFLDEAALRAKLAAAGVKPGEPVIAHCQGGGRASVDAFVLERLGFPTRNYYLGWSDWGNADETPVETGKKP